MPGSKEEEDWKLANTDSNIARLKTLKTLACNCFMNCIKLLVKSLG